MSEVFADDEVPSKVYNKTTQADTTIISASIVTDDLENQREISVANGQVYDCDAPIPVTQPQQEKTMRDYPASTDATPTKKVNKLPFFHYSNIITLVTIIAMLVAVIYGILSASGAFDKNENEKGSQDNFVNDGGSDDGDNQEVLDVCAFQSDVGYDIRGDGSLLLRQFINTGDDTVTVELEYNDVGWIAMAFSESTSMVPNTAIIALPDDNTVQKFLLSSKSLSGVNPLDGTGQTLSDATVTQENGSTIMTFTKKLVELDEISVIKGTNNFNWAIGSSNALGFHLDRGSATLLFDQCLEGATAPVAPPVTAPVIVATPAPVSTVAPPPTNSPIVTATNAPIAPPTNAPVYVAYTNAPVYVTAYTNAPISAPVSSY